MAPAAVEVTAGRASPSTTCEPVSYLQTCVCVMWKSGFCVKDTSDGVGGRGFLDPLRRDALNVKPEFDMFTCYMRAAAIEDRGTLTILI